jgi:translation initiation factor IF-2
MGKKELTKPLSYGSILLIYHYHSKYLDWRLLVAKVRIYELAKQLGVTNKQLLEEFHKLGVELKSHSSSVDEETLTLFMEMTGRQQKGSKPAAQPPTEAKAAEAVKLKEAKPKAAPAKARPVAQETAVAVAPPATGITLTEAITVKELAEKLGQKSNIVIKKLMEMGHLVSINQLLKVKVALKVAEAFGVEAQVVSIEKEAPLEEPEDESLKVSRPPVITIMGHVDHGKTLLLDAIRQTKVVEGEAGGITQHIGAYKVKLDHGEVAFLDTPGHEAFTAMRARGAQVTDVVVLVVAADDGVMPQTVEAINHAKAAQVPILVAVNKIDKPEANPEKVRQELTKYDLVPEEWGGNTIFVDVSAKQKKGLDTLLEMLLLEAEMLELKANPNKLARGTIVEARLDKGRGAVATVLVQSGTLHVGDAFVCGLYSGRVRALLDDRGKKIKQAPPSTPVEVLGLSGIPQAGDAFVVVDNERRAHQIAESRRQKEREESLAGTSRITLEDLYQQIQDGGVKELNVIIKADVQGSIEAVTDALEKLSTPEVKIRPIHGSAGGITESDVMLASASNAIIIGFNVRPQPKAAILAEREKVEINLYTVIYQLVADVKAAMEGLLEPVYREVFLGKAEVREVFSVSKVGKIAGCYVTEGKMVRGATCRLIRDSVVIYEGKIDSLKRFKEVVNEVAAGYECGIALEGFQDIKQGDVIEVYTQEEVSR